MFQGVYSFKSLPLIVFSGVSVLASFLGLLLPETLGTVLPDTVEEAKKLKYKINKEQKK